MRVQLLLTLIIALFSGAKSQARDETQEHARAAVKKLGGTVRIDGKDPSRPVIGINLDSTPVTDDDLMNLKTFPQLRVLSLNQTPISDTGLEHIKGLTARANFHASSASGGF
jgi:hypothetical protein